MNTIDSEVDQILCDLHDLGFHGKDLAHLETLAEYILKSKAQEANKAQHMHRFDDDTYRCEYCGLTPRELHDNTSRLTSEKGKADGYRRLGKRV